MVLAEGDSYTWGLGAPRGASWPAHLEAGWEPAGGLHVINQGRLSANTWVVRQSLEEDLARWQPHAVVFLVGNANWSDLRGWSQGAPGGRLPWDLKLFRLARFLQEDLALRGGRAPEAPALSMGPCQRPLDSCGDPDLARATQLLDRDPGQALALFDGATTRLPRCAAAWVGAACAEVALGREEDAGARVQSGLQATGPDPGLVQLHQEQLMAQGHQREVRDWLEGQPSLPPGDMALLGRLQAEFGDLDSARETWPLCARDKDVGCTCAWGLVDLAFREGRTFQARILLDRFAESSLACVQYVPILHRLCAEGREDQARRWLEQGLARDPGSWLALVRAAAPCLGPTHLPALREGLLGSGADPRQVDAVLEALRRGEEADTALAPWIEAGVTDLVRTVRAHGVPVLLSTYPFPGRVNPLLRRVATDEDVPLVDHEARFQELLAQGHTWDQLFVPDGNNPLERNDHCSAEGYAVMADSVETALQGLLSAGQQ